MEFYAQQANGEQSVSKTLDQPHVLIVVPDPEPGKLALGFPRKRPIASGNSHRPISSSPFKAQGRVPGILPPKFKTLMCGFLDISRKAGKGLSEASGYRRIHPEELPRPDRLLLPDLRKPGPICPIPSLFPIVRPNASGRGDPSTRRAGQIPLREAVLWPTLFPSGYSWMRIWAAFGIFSSTMKGAAAMTPWKWSRIIGSDSPSSYIKIRKEFFQQ